MKLTEALRLDSSPFPDFVVSLVGSGGKTTALFKLARELLSAGNPRILITATTHLGAWQIPLADHHLIVLSSQGTIELPPGGVILVTGEVENERTTPVIDSVLEWLHKKSNEQSIPLLIEADGSRQKPLKAPARHEPPIPEFTDLVVHVSGLSALNKPLDENLIHRAEIFSELTGLSISDNITVETLTKYLTHPEGAMKNIPPRAKRIALLNQADTPELLSICGILFKEISALFDAVVAGSIQNDEIYLFERTAGIVLAAGASSRFGQPKQLLDWNGKSFARHVTETALHAGLEPVVVVTGSHHKDVESQLLDLPVQIVHNEDYETGQSSSIKRGINSLPSNAGSAIFLLADQPQIPVEVIRALTESHTRERQSILAPLVLEERRANPVLFDRVTFHDLLQLEGDMGGRGIFDKHKVSYLPWHDDILLFDVDTADDYERLKGLKDE